MGNEKKDEEEEKGFEVRDRRFSAKQEPDSPAKEEKKREEPSEEGIAQGNEVLPDISFTNLVLSISTSALIQLGVIEDPVSKQPSKNLPLAKQTIDLIGMLQEKTKGKLTSEEEKILEHILYDLRLRYVKAAG
jgi:hypothetical protein